MAFSKVSAQIFVALLCTSSVSPTLACGSCSIPVNPPSVKPPGGGVLPPVGGLPPVGTLPPVGGLPPVGKLPPVGGVLPPVGGLPPVGKLPPVGGVLPPVGGLPPVGELPPVGGILPPVGGVQPPVTKPMPTPCAPPSKKPAKCPINVLKLGACVDLLGGLVHIGLGDPAVNKCCPVLKNLAKVEAAACLCTALKVKALNLKLYVPIALEVLISCGKTPPPGYTCSI